MRSPEELEKQVDRLLRSLPDRPAPRSLEASVLREIARRADLPWWRQSFAAWPVAARAVFLVLSAAAAALVIAVLIPVENQPVVAAHAALRAWSPWASFAGALANAGSALAAHIPPTWIYGALAVLAVCYGALALTGAAAMRLLRQHSSSSASL
jgi:hypothetical protein